ncbi:MAG: hypothetical protein HY553_20745 [Elusimicrobia bacterium]|nr:hypothetical protein [Elusimicrobiota bacterium]
MRYGLWGLAVVLFAEVLRYLHAEIRKRRALDVRSFPAELSKAARLGPGTLEHEDHDETARGLGLLVRVDLALAALIAALAKGLSVAGLLFWVGLALGPAQILFLAPAVALGLNARQPRAVGAMLRGSVWPFAVSGLCALWLTLGRRAPEPATLPQVQQALSALQAAAPPPPAAGMTYGGKHFTASFPDGWSSDSLDPDARHVRFYPAGADRASPDLFAEIAIYQASGFEGARGLAATLLEGLGPIVPQDHWLGSIQARSVVYVAPAGQVRRRIAAAHGDRVYTLDCFGRESRKDEAEAMCRLAASSFAVFN